MADSINKKRPHQVGSEKAISRLVSKMGLNAICQQKIGAFMVYTGTFERHIELAAWAVLEIGAVSGTRPFTDKVGVSDILSKIRTREKGRMGSLGAAIDMTCDAADDLLAYRNAIAHGWLSPSADEKPTFMSNVAWYKEIRARPFQDAHISENLLDAAVDSAYVICRAALAIWRACSGPDAFRPESMESALENLRRAKAQANELRHLTELMNSEMY